MTSNATKSEPLPALRTTNHSKIADPLINFCRYCRFWLSPSSALLLTLLWVQNPEHKLDFEALMDIDWEIDWEANMAPLRIRALERLKCCPCQRLKQRMTK